MQAVETWAMYRSVPLLTLSGRCEDASTFNDVLIIKIMTTEYVRPLLTVESLKVYNQVDRDFRLVLPLVQNTFDLRFRLICHRAMRFMTSHKTTTVTLSSLC